MTKWFKRRRVKNCIHLEYIDCPRCGLVEVCYHEDNEDMECTEKVCPLWNGKKWKPAERSWNDVIERT